MVYTVPNAGRLDNLDLQTLAAAHARTGWRSGCDATAPNGNMVVNVSAGVWEINGRQVVYNGGTVTIGTAGASNPRLDLIVGTLSGTLTVVTGTVAPTGTEVMPGQPDSTVLLWLVQVPANDTNITTGQLIDKRVGLEPRPIFNVKDYGAKGDLVRLAGTDDGRANFYYGYALAGSLNVFRSPSTLARFPASVAGQNIIIANSATYVQGGAGNTTAGRQNSAVPSLFTISSVSDDGRTVTLSGSLAQAVGNPNQGGGVQGFYCPALIYATSPSTGLDCTGGSATVTIRGMTFDSIRDTGKRLEFPYGGAFLRHYYGTVTGGTQGTNSFTVSPTPTTTVKGVECWIGTIDDAAIVRAITAAGEGGQVYYPQGNYWINSTIKPLSGQLHTGDGPGADREWVAILASNIAASGSTSFDVFGPVPTYIPKHGILRVGLENETTGWEFIWYTNWVDNGNGTSTFTIGQATNLAAARGLRSSTALAHDAQSVGGNRDGEQVVIDDIQTDRGGGTRIFRTGDSVATLNFLTNSRSIWMMFAPYSSPFIGYQLPAISNVTLTRLRLNGRQEYQWDGDGQPGQVQNMHGVSLWGTQNWRILQVTSESHDGDGIYGGRGDLHDAPGRSVGTIIRDCTMHYCLRNGMMFSDHDGGLIDRARYAWNQQPLADWFRKWLTSDPSLSTYTSADVDFEPNLLGQSVSYNIIQNSAFLYSEYIGLQVSRPTNVLLNGNVFRNNIFIDAKNAAWEVAAPNAKENKWIDCKAYITQQGKNRCARIVRMKTGTNNEIIGCRFKGPGTGVGTSEWFKVDWDGTNPAIRTVIRDCTFDGTGGNFSEQNMFKIDVTAQGTIIEGCEFIGLVVSFSDTTMVTSLNRFSGCRNGSGVVDRVKTRQRGLTTVPVGGAVVVPHFLATTPSAITLAPQANPGTGVVVYVSAKTGTDFTITAAPAGTAFVCAYDATTSHEERY